MEIKIRDDEGDLIASVEWTGLEDEDLLDRIGAMKMLDRAFGEYLEQKIYVSRADNVDPPLDYDGPVQCPECKKWGDQPWDHARSCRHYESLMDLPF